MPSGVLCCCSLRQFVGRRSFTTTAKRRRVLVALHRCGYPPTCSTVFASAGGHRRKRSTTSLGRAGFITLNLVVLYLVVLPPWAPALGGFSRLAWRTRRIFAHDRCSPAWLKKEGTSRTLLLFWGPSWGRVPLRGSPSSPPLGSPGQTFASLGAPSTPPPPGVHLFAQVTSCTSSSRSRLG